MDHLQCERVTFPGTEERYVGGYANKGVSQSLVMLSDFISIPRCFLYPGGGGGGGGG